MTPERVFFIPARSAMRDRFRACWEICKAMTEPMELVLRPHKAKRSGDQNRRYWALLREVSAVVWIDGRRFPDLVWHEQFKRWFIGMEDYQLPDGATEQRGISTTTLTVREFNEYMASIEQWCADQGFPVMQEAA